MPPATRAQPRLAFTLTIDTVAPTAPVITGDTGNAHSTISITGTAEAASTIKVYDGANLLGTTNVNSSGGWNYTTGALAAGTHNFTATATDAAGNISALSQPVDPVIGSSGSVHSNGSTFSHHHHHSGGVSFAFASSANTGGVSATATVASVTTQDTTLQPNAYSDLATALAHNPQVSDATLVPDAHSGATLHGAELFHLMKNSLAH